MGRLDRAADSIPVKHLHSSLNKQKFPIHHVSWTPEGRRLLTASSSGEFTLWNGMGFNFETIMQAHDSTVRAAAWSHNDEWFVSTDHEGNIKYWQPNFNNVKTWKGHDQPIRGIAFAPTDSKFVTGGDDNTLKVWDFAKSVEESQLTGHQWEVRCLDWHPTKGLIVSGSKDHSVKLWDPRNARCLTTLSSSKNQVSRTLFEPTQGHFLATTGRDQIVRIFDLRMMRDMLLCRGHINEVTSLAWHPIHKNLLSTGGHQGAIHHYLLDEQNPPAGQSATISPYDTADPENAPAQTIYPAHSIPHAHEQTGPVWSLAWHPLGHILASGANDRITRFWTRARPGDTVCFNDRYHVGPEAAEAQGTYSRKAAYRARREEEAMEEEDEADGLVDQNKSGSMPVLPGLSLPSDDAFPGLPGLAPMAVAANGPPLPLPPPQFQTLPQHVDLASLAGMDPSRMAQLIGGRGPPPIPGHSLPFLPPGMPPVMPPPNFNNGIPGMLPFPPGMPPQGYMPPQGFQPLPQGYQPPQNGNGIPGMGMPPVIGAGADVGAGAGGGGSRKRAPLPSQEESLQLEQRQGRFRHVR
jgi:polyadenylation factor subunit 2